MSHCTQVNLLSQVMRMIQPSNENVSFLCSNIDTLTRNLVELISTEWWRTSMAFPTALLWCFTHVLTILQVCHNLTRTCHNLTRTWHNLIRTCHNLTRTCHNLTRNWHNLTRNCTCPGCDPTKSQWSELSKLTLRKGHLVLMDCAYQGFASGDSEEDAFAIRWLPIK